MYNHTLTSHCCQEAAIRRWNIDANRSINYNSLEPVLRILQNKTCPAAELWAIWALANLTNVSSQSQHSVTHCRLIPSTYLCCVGSKYCPMVESEGGIPLLKEIFDDVSTEKMTRELAGRTLAICDVHRHEQ